MGVVSPGELAARALLPGHLDRFVGIKRGASA
jgi:hypothetical protein